VLLRDPVGVHLPGLKETGLYREIKGLSHSFALNQTRWNPTLVEVALV
jgi:hypothetical protein